MAPSMHYSMTETAFATAQPPAAAKEARAYIQDYKNVDILGQRAVRPGWNQSYDTWCRRGAACMYVQTDSRTVVRRVVCTSESNNIVFQIRDTVGACRAMNIILWWVL